MVALSWRRGAVPFRRDVGSSKALEEGAGNRESGGLATLGGMAMLSTEESDVALVRCAQPLVGLTGSTSSRDEKILGHLAGTSVAGRAGACEKVAMLYDARPQISATANLARGGGYERMSQYKNCELEFLGIQNIHAVREAFVRLHGMFSKVQSSNRHQELAHAHVEAQLRESDGSGSSGYVLGDGDEAGGGGGGEREAGTGNALNTSRMTWFHHLVDVLSGSVQVARCIDGGTSALVHCSDGWDRTSQVCALVQLFLDPYFRTLRGFQVLVEKEWLSFGHKFAERCGHDTSSKKSREDYLDKQRSPVFVQFLDCVWQICKQFPRYFEFNDLLLSAALRHVYSARYGTFLFNSEKERMDDKLSTKSVSLWTEINVHVQPFMSEVYDPSTATAEASTRMFNDMQLEVPLLSLWPAYELLWRQGTVAKRAKRTSRGGGGGDRTRSSRTLSVDGSGVSATGNVQSLSTTFALPVAKTHQIGAQEGAGGGKYAPALPPRRGRGVSGDSSDKKKAPPVPKRSGNACSPLPQSPAAAMAPPAVVEDAAQPPPPRPKTRAPSTGSIPPPRPATKAPPSDPAAKPTTNVGSPVAGLGRMSSTSSVSSTTSSIPVRPEMAPETREAPSLSEDGMWDVA
jgi:hypothetical protein